MIFYGMYYVAAVLFLAFSFVFAEGTRFMLLVITVLCLIILAVFLAGAIGAWRVFEKMGYPGYQSLIPFYYDAVLLKVSFGCPWLVIFIFIPIVRWLILSACMMKIAKSFNKSIWFGVGLFFIQPIFMCVLGHTGNEYKTDELVEPVSFVSSLSNVISFTKEHWFPILLCVLAECIMAA